ncbi:MAG: hypothetical protein HY353_02450 [Candidatus Omnitrophica bacterium]|nr:hypothetical protein [Candidatus Omnitrophota bacterium]
MIPRSRGRWKDLAPQLLEGRVRTDARNRLVYQVGSQRLALDGTWALTRDHDLSFTVRARDERPSQTVYLKGALLKAEANALVVAVHQADRENAEPSHRVALSGRWSADAKNRLVFSVDKADGTEDRLTFQGGWEVGPRHELLYRYRQRATSTRTADERTLIFAGAWDITGADRLVYRLAGSDSAFEFKASLQSPSLQARDGRIVYQVGIGLAGGRTRTARVVLFGTWKLHKDKTVSFEIPYTEGRRGAIQFGATYAFAGKNEVALELYGRRRQPLGISVMFSRRLLEDARWFVRVRKEGEATEALAGVQGRF